MNPPSKTKDIDAIIAKNLRIARYLREMTLKDIGEILDVSGQQVQKYETGKSAISIDSLVKLAKALDLPISFFFEEIDIKTL